MRKSVALVNEALAEAQASTLFYNSSATDSAIALLERTRTMLLAEATAIEDLDLQTEAANLLKLESNMRNGGYTYNNSASEQRPLACAFATSGLAGQSAPWAAFALALLALLGRRVRRN